MTDVAFHFNAPDRVAYTCRLLRKATSSGARLVVTGSAETLAQLDADLWSLSPADFVAHCYLDKDPSTQMASPVILTTALHEAPHQQVLVNLGQQIPEGFERFERVIEIVGLDEESRHSARSRWKSYADQGYTITRHDLALQRA
jgi:DNA polymerase III subunit chi